MTEYPKLDPDFKRKWVEALRSGKYLQGKSLLASQSKEDADAVNYCCLGVAGCTVGIPVNQMREESEFSDIIDYEVGSGNPNLENKETSFIMSVLPRELIFGNLVDKLVSLNDEQGKTFLEIADWIEENL